MKRMEGCTQLFPSKAVFLPAFLLFFSSPLFAAFTYSTIDEGTDGEIVVTPSGIPHVAYYGGMSFEYPYSIKYATFNGVTWSTQTIKTDATTLGRHNTPSIDLDTSNFPVISFCDTDGLQVARWDGTTWLIQQVDATCDYGKTSIKVGRTGNIHVLYRRVVGARADLRYGLWNGSAWSVSTLDSTGTLTGYQRLGLDVDSDDNPHFAYYVYDGYNTKTIYGRRQGVVLSTQTVPILSGSLSTFGGFALDPTNRPRIVGAGPTNYLEHTVYTGSSWPHLNSDYATHVVDATLAIDVSGLSHVVYTSDLAGGIWYTVVSNGIARPKGVATAGTTGVPISLAVDAGKNIHFLYADLLFTTPKTFLMKYAYSPPLFSSDAGGGSSGGSSEEAISAKIFPNPASPTEASPLNLTEMPAGASVRIYSVRGALIKKLDAADDGTAIWTGVNEAGEPVPSGVYWVVVKVDGRSKTFKTAVQR